MRGAIVFFACFAVAHACSCTNRTPSLEELFCKSHFVTHAKVTGRSVDGHLIYYDLEHKEVYKPKDMKIPIRVGTVGDERWCGVTDLEEGKEYLIGGPVLYYLDGIMSMYVSRCNLLRNWAEVSGQVEKFAKIQCKNETETPIIYE